MTMQRYHDCHCEDYPCCGHYDTLYGDEDEGNYCDDCGGSHSPSFDCVVYDDDEDDEEEFDDDVTMYQEYEAEDRHLDSVYEDAFGLEG